MLTIRLILATSLVALALVSSKDSTRGDSGALTQGCGTCETPQNPSGPTTPRADSLSISGCAYRTASASS